MAGAFVARVATVTESDVEHAVGSERELAAVVVRLRLVDPENELRHVRWRRPRPSAERVFLDPRVAVAVREVDVELRCRRARTRDRATPVHRRR